MIELKRLAVGNGIPDRDGVWALLMPRATFKSRLISPGLEASDLNHPLPPPNDDRKHPALISHHSLVVVNLAESAAEAIGANAKFLRRVCSLFSRRR